MINDKFYIFCNGSGYSVILTNSKTLRGAKMAASRTFSESVGSRLDVLIHNGSDFEEVAVKPAFEKWVNI